MKKSYITSFLFLVFGLFFNSSNAQSTAYISSNSGNYSVVEGNVYSFKVNLYSVSTTPIVIDISVTNGTALSSDYTFTPITVTIPAGQLSSSTLTITTTNDSTIEQNESLTINGTVTSGNTTNATITSSLTIIDNDKIPTLIANSTYSIYENSASTNIYFSLSNPYSSNIVINFFTTNGTAGSTDFTAVNTTATIVAGQTSATVNIPINNDSLTESDETFTVTSNVTSGNTTNSSLVTTITIIDNDTIPTVTLNSYNVTEGGSAYVYANLDRIYNSNIIIHFTTSTGTAGTSDYTTTNTTSTISAGSSSVYITIPTTDDTIDEPNESFTITGTITSGNTTNLSSSATITIVDNDGLPDLIFYSTSVPPIGTSNSVEEGQNANIIIGLTQASTVPTVVQITTQNGTAGSIDYTPLTRTITIPAGTTYYSYYNDPLLFVPTILDQLQESTESFTINATITSGNTYNTTASQAVSILDNYNLNAQTDNVNPVAELGGTFPLLANDTLHGLPLNYSDVTITLGTNTIGATINAQGILSIPSNAPIGYYTISYTICETATATNCDTATVNVQVVSPLDVTYAVSYSDYNSDGFVSAGDVVNYQFNIKNNGNAPITNIVNQNAYNIILSGGPIANLNAGQTDSTTFTGIHILTQDDINFGYFSSPNQGSEIFFKGIYYGYEVNGWARQTNTFSLPISDGIKVVAFVDANSNGVKDTSEIDFPLGHFNYEINNNGVVHNLYSTPYYLYESNPTTIYNLTYAVDSQYAANNTCTTSYSNVTVAQGSGVTTYYFPITVSAYQDLSVNIHNYNMPPIPGNYYYNYITYKNNSNVTVASGTVTFTKDSALTINTYPSGATPTATGFTYNFSNLLPYETRYIGVSMQVPTLPTVALGQLVNNSATINMPVGDILPLNNNSAITQTIVGSYDPNDKTENHGGKILYSSFTSNDYLTYTIQFENTGTANAINIKVQDQLDSKLDETSIKMVASSASYTLERVNNNLTWKFNGINLPPSVPNSQTGHGYITFQIKPRAGYAIGDIIPNSASIYFDFNPAIVTETCNTQFVATLSNSGFVFNDFKVYPNPTKNNLTISNEFAIDEVEISSVLGQKMITKKVNDLQATIDTSELSNGIYFVKVSSQGNEKTVKIVKE